MYRRFRRYVSFYFYAGLAHADHCHLLTFFDIENRKLIQNLAYIDASGSTYPDVFPLGLAQQDRPYLLMICVWICTNILPKIDGFSALQLVCIPWSFSAGPRHIADIFSWRPKPFLVVKCSTDSYFGISRLYLCSSWHLLSEKSSAWNPVHLDNADRMFISVCYFYFVTQTNCPEIDTLCTVSIDYRQKIF